jgi:REP element-mobilizing transposase RayT
MSETYQRLAHSSWDCKYHVVFVPNALRETPLARDPKDLWAVEHF